MNRVSPVSRKLLEFFEAAVRARTYGSSPECLSYVAYVLAERASSDVSRDPLSVRLLDLSYMPERRVLVLQSVGDDALFLSGFYPEALPRRGLDVRAAVMYGRSAYSELGSRTRHRLFLSLSSEFDGLRYVLSDLRKSLRESSPEEGKAIVPVI